MPLTSQLLSFPSLTWKTSPFNSMRPANTGIIWHITGGKARSPYSWSRGFLPQCWITVKTAKFYGFCSPICHFNNMYSVTERCKVHWMIIYDYNYGQILSLHFDTTDLWSWLRLCWNVVIMLEHDMSCSWLRLMLVFDGFVWVIVVTLWELILSLKLQKQLVAYLIMFRANYSPVSLSDSNCQ